MYLTVLQICHTKVNQGTLCTAKLNEGFAILIPKVFFFSSLGAGWDAAGGGRRVASASTSLVRGWLPSKVLIHGSIRPLPQVRSGQVRPARQWRARFRAQAQKAQYVHNCYLHAAEIDK